MARRLDLQALLETLLGSGNVYFQPPAGVQMQYPCIVYELDRIPATFANNKPYRLTHRYLATVIDRNPDSIVPDKMASLPMCLMDRFFATNNLNHYVFVLHF